MKKSVICAAGAVLAACSFGGLSVRAEALSDGTMTETAVVKSNLAGAFRNFTYKFFLRITPE